MDQQFWRERWAAGKIAFHKAKPNAFLTKYVERLGGAASAGTLGVLVPLCGKSMDLGFLAGEGFAVTGVELVREAADAFFAEHGLSAVQVEERWNGFPSLRAAGIRIAVGDFFQLRLPDDGQRFGAAYDRAALVAMKPEDRDRYVATLLGALEPGARLLLVTFHYEGALSGPPFSVPEAEVRRLFASCTLELLESTDITDSEPIFRERGATYIAEQAWLVTCK